MTRKSRFDGVFTALITPFTEAGEIDWPAFDALIDRQIAAGVAGLVPVGTTGEAATLSAEEASALIARTVERARGAAYVLAGTGSNNTRKAIDATRRAADLGVDGVLLVTPYYNRPSQEGMVAHFAAIAEAAPVDNVLYSVPGRTGVALEPETVATLARSHGNVVAIKEAGGDPSRVSALRRACGRDFAVHCGDDGLALAFFALGACGLTSVFSNYDPETCVALWDAWASGETDRALRLHDIAKPIMDGMFIDNSPAPVKHLVSRDYGISDHVRPPIGRMTAAKKEALLALSDSFRRDIDEMRNAGAMRVSA
jgi:4-hydroxy-tetrahydrodipicolinate synthase